MARPFLMILIPFRRPLAWLLISTDRPLSRLGG
jgi:hypothetical protein